MYGVTAPMSGSHFATERPLMQEMIPNFSAVDHHIIEQMNNTKAKLLDSLLSYPNLQPNYTTTSITPPRIHPTRAPYGATSPTAKHPTKFHTRIEKPDTCDMTYDAISIIREELFIFSGRYLWRVGPHGLKSPYPVEIKRLWNILWHTTHIDAVYERLDKKIVFFIGKYYYLFHGTILEPGYPMPLTHLGLPDTLEKIDGAMVWGLTNKTYFFSGSMYWRFDEEVEKVELDYPREIMIWKGVGSDIDAVLQWRDGNTYFFKGKGYWEFNDQRMKVEENQQKLSAPFWMGPTACPPELTNPIEDNVKGKPVTQSLAKKLLAPILTITLSVSIYFLFV